MRYVLENIKDKIKETFFNLNLYNFDFDNIYIKKNLNKTLISDCSLILTEYQYDIIMSYFKEEESFYVIKDGTFNIDYLEMVEGENFWKFTTKTRYDKYIDSEKLFYPSANILFFEKSEIFIVIDYDELGVIFSDKKFYEYFKENYLNFYEDQEYYYSEKNIEFNKNYNIELKKYTIRDLNWHFYSNKKFRNEYNCIKYNDINDFMKALNKISNNVENINEDYIYENKIYLKFCDDIPVSQDCKEHYDGFYYETKETKISKIEILMALQNYLFDKLTDSNRIIDIRKDYLNSKKDGINIYNVYFSIKI